MLYQLNIHLSENDYFDFQLFHGLESAPGKKVVRNSRISFVVIMVILAALVVLILGVTLFSMIYSAILLLFTLLYAVFFKKILAKNYKAQIKRMKKQGKLPFDPVSTVEFHQDKLVEITPSKRTELNYGVFERICVVKDRYILLYTSSVNAFILPAAQIRTQLNPKELVDFLSARCPRVEYYGFAENA